MKMNVTFSERKSVFPISFGEVHEVTKILDEVYDGDCTVVPKTCDQVLPTKNKFLTDDVTVRAVPVYEVSNTTGGTTVYIAKDE